MAHSKRFQRLTPELKRLRQELVQFEKFLEKSHAPRERHEILPFFGDRLQLSALVGNCYHQDILVNDLVAFEYDLFGDFQCDLVVGDSRRKVYGFVEFEDADPSSLFVKQKNKSSPEWAPRFEHGFSQVVDWFYKLDDMERTNEFEHRFGVRQIQCFGLVVVGREAALEDRERRRLHWRREKVTVNGHRVHCVTFDRLLADMQARVEAIWNVAHETE